MDKFFQVVFVCLLFWIFHSSIGCHLRFENHMIKLEFWIIFFNFFEWIITLNIVNSIEGIIFLMNILDLVLNWTLHWIIFWPDSMKNEYSKQTNMLLPKRGNNVLYKRRLLRTISVLTSSNISLTPFRFLNAKITQKRQFFTAEAK